MRPSMNAFKPYSYYAVYRSLEVFDGSSSRSYAKLWWVNFNGMEIRLGVSCVTASRRILRLQPARRLCRRW